MFRSGLALALAAARSVRARARVRPILSVGKKVHRRQDFSSNSSISISNTSSSSSPRSYSSSTPPEPEEHEGVEEGEPIFGTYSLILPPEPLVCGVEHIRPRIVPAHIRAPHYAPSNPQARAGSVGLGLDHGHGAGLASAASGLDHSESHNARVGEQGGSQSHSSDYDYTTNLVGESIIKLGTEEERRVREAAALAKVVLAKAESLVRVGITSNEIDETLHEFIISKNAYPSPLHYSGYPRSCCVSVNNVVAHGVPDDRKLEDGDIVNVDVTVYVGGYHGDTSKTFLVGNVDTPGRLLVQTTTSALHAGIAACAPGVPFKEIGKAIHTLVSDRGFSVSQQFTGHGIGRVFHQRPWILHHRNDEPGIMKPGHCFTIEPCLVQGDDPRAWIFPDGWTASTETGARSAQAEHMVLITETGVDVITL